MDYRSLEAAQALWDFHLQRDELHPADAIFVMGSIDFEVPRYAIELYHQGLAPLLILSGGLGNFTDGVFDRPEADIFADMALAAGVPAKALVVENRSSNSGENVHFTRKVLDGLGVELSSIIAVQKPFMGKRARLTVSKQWPEIHCMVSSQSIDFQDYHNDDYNSEDITHIMVGDFERILKYPALGYQDSIDIPEPVMAAYVELRIRGYDQHCMKQQGEQRV